MTKEKQVTLKLEVKSAIEVLQCLDAAVAGYSKEFPPERVVRLCEVVEQLDKELEKAVL